MGTSEPPKISGASPNLVVAPFFHCGVVDSVRRIHVVRPQEVTMEAQAMGRGRTVVDGGGERRALHPSSLLAKLLALSLVVAGGVACDKSTGKRGDKTTPPTPSNLELKEGAPLDAPDEVVGSGQGMPGGVIDAGLDRSGNLWVVTRDSLYVRRYPFEDFERYGSADGLKVEEIRSVGGGLKDTAWVGYLGEGDSDDDPEWMRMSGGVSRVELDGTDIRVRHFNLIAPPGLYPSYPDGRHKLRTCSRAYPTKTGRYAGDAWFGCNHGVGMVTANSMVWEHHHPVFCEWDPVRQDCTVRSGDVHAVARTSNGDLWFGGTYGVMKVLYDDGQRGNFWGAEVVRNTSLWESPLEPNRFGSEDIVGIAVASDGTLWAASRHSGIARRRDDERVEIYLESDGLPSNRMEDATIDNDEGLWLAVRDGGIVRLNLRTGEWQRAPGLPSNKSRRVIYERTEVGDFMLAVVQGAVAMWEL